MEGHINIKPFFSLFYLSRQKKNSRANSNNENAHQLWILTRTQTLLSQSTPDLANCRPDEAQRAHQPHRAPSADYNKINRPEIKEGSFVSSLSFPSQSSPLSEKKKTRIKHKAATDKLNGDTLLILPCECGPERQIAESSWF